MKNKQPTAKIHFFLCIFLFCLCCENKSQDRELTFPKFVLDNTTLHYSYLKEIFRTGTVKACFGKVTENFSDAQINVAIETFKNAATVWNDALTDYEEWPVKELNFEIQKTKQPCSRKDTIDVLMLHGCTTCISMTYVGPDSYSMVVYNNNIQRTILHEYGHVIGMDNSYYHSDPTQGIDDSKLARKQPASVMNTMHSTVLEPDDILGIVQVFKTVILNESLSCPDRYATVFSNKKIICTPKKAKKK